MRAIPATPGKGLDTVAVITREWARAHPEITFYARYLRLDGAALHVPDASGGDHVGCWSLSESEIADIISAGAAVLPVQFGPRRGDRLCHSLGLDRGSNAALSAYSLGIPHGCHLWCDLEGASARKAGTVDCYGYVDGWSAAVVAQGYRAGLYVGDDEVPLSGRELYRLPLVTSYWASAVWGVVRHLTPSPRGWAIRQTAPTAIDGLSCDRDSILADGRGETPYVCAA
jgi:hypothetical protein